MLPCLQMTTISFNYIIDEYLSKNLDDRSILIFQEVLKQKNPNAYHRFSSLINVKTDNKFLKVDTPLRKKIHTNEHLKRLQ